MSVPKFYVGQRVVAIVNDEIVKKGQVYTVLGVSKNNCGHDSWAINIGKVAACSLRCLICDKWMFHEGDIIWHPQGDFAPIHEDFKAITFEKIVEKELTSAN